MSSTSYKLGGTDLDKALQVLKRYGCSDFFPRPFEIDAIENSWAKIRPVLENVDLLSYDPRSELRLVAPRQRYTTRSATLLDPIDLLLLTGFATRLIPKFQAARAGLYQARVFSTGLDGSLPDQLYDLRLDYRRFRGHIDTLLPSAKYIATADINDFFPRIYLHRLENSIDALLKDAHATRIAMRFFEAWSAGTSYGVPVGTHCVYPFAELTLHEVDTYLADNGVSYARFVDDYVISGATESECLRGLYLLGSRLQETQGLSLNAAKTRVWRKKDYKRRIELQDRPDARLRKQVIDKVFGGDEYAEVDYDSLDAAQQRILDKLNVEAILEASLSEEGLTDFSSVRFILNVLSVLSRPEITDLVLRNLARLYPVSHSVARFFRTLDEIGTADRREVGNRILAFINSGEYVPDFQTMWLLEPFCHSPQWNNLPELRRLAQNHSARMVRRQAMLALGQLGDRSALLDVKTRLNECADWEQRAVVYACRSLPTDEKTAFFKTVRVPKDWKLDSLLLKAVVEAAK